MLEAYTGFYFFDFGGEAYERAADDYLPELRS